MKGSYKNSDRLGAMFKDSVFLTGFISILQTTNPQTGIRRWLPSNADDIRKALLTSVLTLVVALIVFFSKHISRGLKAAFVFGWKRIKLQKVAETLYRRRLASDLRAIQILRMTESKDLESFYIPLTLASWIPPE